MMKKADETLRTYVLDELEWDPSIEADDIGVAVSGGIVTLSGRVPSYPQMHTAERAALRVEGSEGVVNDITVQLPDDYKRPDTDITKVARRAIEWHIQLPADEIRVKVEDGWITLEGTVGWDFQATRAEQAVRHLLGVRGVHNDLTVGNSPAPSDVHKRIRKVLERRAGRDIDRLRTSLDDATVP